MIWGVLALAVVSIFACGFAAFRVAMRIPRREDMYNSPLALGVAGGGFAGFVTLAVGLLSGTADKDLRTVLLVMLPLGGSVVLATCVWQFLTWRNQTIVMLDEKRFRYTDWLGRKREYSLDDLIEIRRSLDDIVLRFPDGKARFDSAALLSSRLTAAITAAVERRK